MMNSDTCILAVDAGGTLLKAAFIYNHALVKDSFFSIPVCSGGTEEEIQNSYRLLGQTAHKLETELKITAERVSVCIPGPFDYSGGRCLMVHKYQSVYGKCLRPWIWEGLGENRPIDFLHDSTAFILGAAALLRNPVPRRLCGVIIGTGLGFASMIDGTVLKNSSGGPGISIYRSPYKNGIAEDYVSRRGILKRYHELTKQENGISQTDIDVKEIADLAKSGDPAALQVFQETGAHLAHILAPVISENRFELLLLGGAISKSAELFLPALKEGLSHIYLNILPAEDPDLSPLIGAAEYSFSNSFLL